MALVRYLRKSTLRRLNQACRGEVSCVTATFGLVVVSFVIISFVNISKSPTILTILDDMPINVDELKKDSLSTILLEQDNGEVYIAFRLKESAALLKKIYNGRGTVNAAKPRDSKLNTSDIKSPINGKEQGERITIEYKENSKDNKRFENDTLYPIPSYNSLYLINSKNICSEKTLSFIVLVHTATENFMRRSSIRETWANSMLFNNHSMRVVFLVGIPERESTQTLIKHEQKLFKDIVQGDFRDTYHNLTHKGVLGLRWVSEHCPQAKFIVKIDDDVFVNVFKLIHKMETDMKNETRHIWCQVRPKGTSPIQREKGKWKVDENQFKNMSAYPVSYCDGYFVMLTSDIVPELFEASKTTPFFWIDDIYLFGLLPDKIGRVELVQLRNLNLNEKKAIECFENKKEQCDLLVANAHTDGIMDKLWFGVLEQYKSLAKEYSKETLFQKT